MCKTERRDSCVSGFDRPPDCLRARPHPRSDKFDRNHPKSAQGLSRCTWTSQLQSIGRASDWVDWPFQSGQPKRLHQKANAACMGRMVQAKDRSIQGRRHFAFIFFRPPPYGTVHTLAAMAIHTARALSVLGLGVHGTCLPASKSAFPTPSPSLTTTGY